MNKPIRTYDDLLAEQQRLDILLLAQRELVVADFKTLRGEVKSATTSLSFLGKLLTKDKKHALLNFGTDKAIDLVLKKVVLARAGWLTRLAIPFLVKNYSSHFVDKGKHKVVEKIFGWFSHKNGHGKAAPEAFGEES
jgi:hypothetical protein